MGNRASSSNKVSIETSTTLDMMTEKIMSNKQSTLQSTVNAQTVTIDIGPTGEIGGDLEVGQSIDTKNQASGELDAASLSSMEADMQNKLSASLEQAAKAKTDLGSTGNTSANNVSSIKNALSMSIKDTMKIENYNSIVQNTINKQDATIRINGKVRKGVKIDQKIVAEIIATNVLKSVMDSTNKILAEQGSSVRVEQSGDSESSGVGDIFQGLFKMIGNIFGSMAAAYIAVPLSLCCCCIIIVAMIVMMIGGKSKTPNTRLVNQAMNKALVASTL